MALKTITGKVAGPDGTNKAAQIVVTLSAPTVIAGTQETVPSQVKITAASDGTYTLTLQANNDMTPTGTFYTVTESSPDGGFYTFTIVVPQTAGPFVMSNIQTAPPAVGPAWDATLVHLAGAETLTGVKHFSAHQFFDGGAEGKIWDIGGQAFNANSYAGVDPTGVADSTTGLQACFTAAIAVNGKAVLPGAYKVTGTITLQPPSGSQFQLDVEAVGSFAAITWAGADSSSLFQVFGWKQGSVRGLKINISPGNSTVAAWDLDVKVGATSTGNLAFYNCGVNIQAGAGTGNMGWRMGHTGGAVGGSEMSGLAWFQCSISGGDNSKSHIGWVNEHPNGVSYYWFGSGGSSLGTLFTNSSTAGAASSAGGASMFFYGGGASSNLLDFQFKTIGVYSIYGGRYELGKKFVNLLFSNSASTIHVMGVNIAAYTPSDGYVFDMQGPCRLVLEGLHAAGTTYTVHFIIFRNNPTSRSTLIMRGCSIAGVDPPYEVIGPTTPPEIWIEGCAIIDGSSNTVALMQTHSGPLTATFSPAYGATVTCDLTAGKRQKVTVTNGSAFNFAAIPGAYDGQEVVIEIFNNSGGAAANPTFDASFLLAGGTAFVSPGTGKRRAITFGYDSTPAKWVELYRTTADT